MPFFVLPRRFAASSGLMSSAGSYCAMTMPVPRAPRSTVNRSTNATIVPSSIRPTPRMTGSGTQAKRSNGASANVPAGNAATTVRFWYGPRSRTRATTSSPSTDASHAVVDPAGP